MAPLFAGGSDAHRSPRRRWTDRVLGIVLGIVIGVGVLVYFVFVHSEGTIDAPKINEAGAGKSATGPQTEPSPGQPAGQGGPKQPNGEGAKRPAEHRPVPVVKVIGGAPPSAGGPKQLRFHKGEQVRFEIETDEPFSFEIRGLGIEQSIESSSIISFKAKKTGQFPVIATSTLIGIADLLITASTG